MRATLLGTGDAYGIPRPACICPQCAEARALGRQRMRSGMLLRSAGASVLLDCSPDISHQLEREGVDPATIDAVVVSHLHHDHCFGLYDLARTRLQAGRDDALPVHGSAGTHERLQKAFGSLFREDAPQVALAPWAAGQRLEFDEFSIAGFETHHWSELETTAFVVACAVGGRDVRVAHATDMGSELPTPRELAQGVDLFLGDGTYLGGPDYGHPGTTRVVEIGRQLGAGRVAITHVGHWGVDEATARARLPDDVALCRDRGDVFSLLP